MAKPSLDTIGSWLEGRLTKFIAGEGEEEKSPEATHVIKEGSSAAGPFSQYSVISSAETSPNASSLNLVNSSSTLLPPSTAPPKRTGSAAPLRPNSFTVPPIDRAASAMDHLRPGIRQASPAPYAYSANASTTSFYQADSSYNAFSHGRSDSSPIEEKTSSNDANTQSQNSPWWGSNDDAAATPTTATFYDVGSSPALDTSGFISPMDTPSFAPTPSPMPSKSTTPHPQSSYNDDEDAEDLGFGNKKKKSVESKKDEDEADPESSSAPAKTTPPPAAKPSKTTCMI